MEAKLSFAAFQEKVFQSELGQIWNYDPLLKQDVWALIDLGYSKEECAIRGSKNIYFKRFSLPWLKLLAKLTIKARIRERHSINTVLIDVSILGQLDEFLISKSYTQPTELNNTLLHEFVSNGNVEQRQGALFYALNIWAEENWLKVKFIPRKNIKLTPKVEVIPEQVLHQVYENFDTLPPMLERLFRLQLVLGCRRIAIKQNLDKIPTPIARQYQLQEYIAARPLDVCLMKIDCLVENNGKWYIRFYQNKVDRWHQLPAKREIRRIIEEQQKWIKQTIGEDYPYLFCHFRPIIKSTYPDFGAMKPLPEPPSSRSEANPMVKMICILIEKEKILDANGLQPKFMGKITRPSRTQEIRVKHGIKAAQLYADHLNIQTTFQHYAPPTREQIAEVDLPFQELLLNPDNKFLPWQSLPESLLKNPKAHELDLEIAPRLVVYGHCTLNPKTPCPVNLFPKCYGCSSFRPSTGKLPLYERQYEGEQQRLTEAETAGAELASEEAKATIKAMDKWLPELQRLANG